MISLGSWRWPALVASSLLTGVLLLVFGVTRLRTETSCVLTFEGPREAMGADARIVQMSFMDPAVPMTWTPRAGHPTEMVLQGTGLQSKKVALSVASASQKGIERSFTRHKEALHKKTERALLARTEAETLFKDKQSQKSTWLAAQPRRGPRVDYSSKIRVLEDRRNALIEKYPTHTDIPLLAKQIRALHEEAGRRNSALAATPKGMDFDKQINEAKIRLDYFSRLAREAEEIEKSAKPLWSVKDAVRIPKGPIEVQGWPWALGAMVGVFGIGFGLTRSRGRSSSGAANGLWKPKADEKPATPVKEVPAPVLEKAPIEPVAASEMAPPPVPPPSTAPDPVELQVVSADAPLPSDPLTEKAAELYAKWVEVCKVLYAPAAEAPQGIIESVGPLLQESIDYLPKGHDILTRYLARTVTPGDLPAHVARTVLMTLTGAQDAGVSPEHRLAMALAALFHDLAVVPRPAAVQEEVGSDIGRLSASVLRRIPGLDPAILVMVEEILIGMDEFKLETWQNVAIGTNLEPLSKVLREIDRFEKVLQKQKSRQDRRVANQ